MDNILSDINKYFNKYKKTKVFKFDELNNKNYKNKINDFRIKKNIKFINLDNNVDIKNDDYHNNILIKTKENRKILSKFKNLLLVYYFLYHTVFKINGERNEPYLSEVENKNNNFYITDFEGKKFNLPYISNVLIHTPHVSEIINTTNILEDIKIGNLSKIGVLIKLWPNSIITAENKNNIEFHEFDTIQHNLSNYDYDDIELNLIKDFGDALDIKDNNSTVKNKINKIYNNENKIFKEKFLNKTKYNNYNLKNINYINLADLKNLVVKTKKNFIYCSININLNYINFIKNNYENNFYEQNCNIFLFLSQILFIFKNQSKHGNCIILIKFTNKSILEQLFFILNKYYEEVNIQDNCFSTITSCELYVSCFDFKGINSYDYQKLLDLYEEILNFDYSLGIKSSQNKNFITNLIDINYNHGKNEKNLKNIKKENVIIKSINKTINKLIRYFNKKIDLNLKICNDLENFIYKSSNNLEKQIYLFNEIINLQYLHSINKCYEINIPLNPMILDYIIMYEDKYEKYEKYKNKNKFENLKLFDVGLGNIKNLNKKIKETKNIDIDIYNKDLDFKDINIDEEIQDLSLEKNIINKKVILFFKNIFNENKWIKNIVEVGFNVGITTDIFLQNIKNSYVLSFNTDDDFDDYINEAKNYIDKKYIGRHSLITGKTPYSIPNFKKLIPNKYFDLIYINGNFSYQIAKKDIMNMKLLAHKNTILLFNSKYDLDKNQKNNLSKAWNSCINNNTIKNSKIYKFNNENYIGFANFII